MKKIIALPFFLFILNFNAQKDFVSKYNIEDFVSNNNEFIENLNPEKIQDRIKFEKKLLQHRIKNSGIIANFFFLRNLKVELKQKMSHNENYIKIRNRNRISSGFLLIGGIGSVATYVMSEDPLVAYLFTIVYIVPSSIILATLPQIGTRKLRAQLLKDYFLSI